MWIIFLSHWAISTACLSKEETRFSSSSFQLTIISSRVLFFRLEGKETTDGSDCRGSAAIVVDGIVSTFFGASGTTEGWASGTLEDNEGATVVAGAICCLDGSSFFSSVLKEESVAGFAPKLNIGLVSVVVEGIKAAVTAGVDEEAPSEQLPEGLAATVVKVEGNADGAVVLNKDAPLTAGAADKVNDGRPALPVPVPNEGLTPSPPLVAADGPVGVGKVGGAATVADEAG